MFIKTMCQTEGDKCRPEPSGDSSASGYVPSCLQQQMRGLSLMIYESDEKFLHR